MTSIAIKANIAWGDDDKTYLAGTNEYEEKLLIVTETWRFKKLCQDNNDLTLPFYIIQDCEGALTLIYGEKRRLDDTHIP